jgi:hypothetical protein
MVVLLGVALPEVVDVRRERKTLLGFTPSG